MTCKEQFEAYKYCLSWQIQPSMPEPTGRRCLVSHDRMQSIDLSQCMCTVSSSSGLMRVLRVMIKLAGLKTCDLSCTHLAFVQNQQQLLKFTSTVNVTCSVFEYTFMALMRPPSPTVAANTYPSMVFVACSAPTCTSLSSSLSCFAFSS